MSKKPKLPYSPEDLATVREIAAKVNIVRIMVVSSNYFRDEILDAIPGIEMRIDLQHQITAFVPFEVKQAWIYLDLAVIATTTTPGHEGQVAFKIDTRLEIRYDATNVTIESKALHRALNAMCHVSGPLHGWSYLRQHIQDAMGRMMLPPMLLPLLPVFEPGTIPVESKTHNAAPVKKTK